mgnify:CR=1 FL=1
MNLQPSINPFQSLKSALDYVSKTPVLEVDVDLVEQLVQHHEYNGDPDEECPYESAMRGDLEVYLDTAMDMQESFEALIDELHGVPAGDPRDNDILMRVHELKQRYAKK